MPVIDWAAVRTILELLYFLSGVVLAVAAVLALRQLRIAEAVLAATKEQLTLAATSLEQTRVDMRIRSTRESITLAAQLCERFADIFLPRMNDIDRGLDELKLLREPWQLRDAAFSDASLMDPTAANEWHGKLDETKVHEEMVHALNELEAFGVYFVRGAADEATAYASLGEAFCRAVELFTPCLVRYRTAATACTSSGRYENTVELYSIWRNRMRHGDLSADAARVNAQLATIEARRIEPVGTSAGGA